MITPQEIDELALCAWKEARGEGPEGCRAVMHVIKNRVKHPGFPNSIHDVIYQKNAFTSMSVSIDPEFNLKPEDTSEAEQAIYEQCKETASTIDTDFDVTLGACFYANLKHIDMDGWFGRHIVQDTIGHPQTIVIKNHTFYK